MSRRAWGSHPPTTAAEVVELLESFARVSVVELAPEDCALMARVLRGGDVRVTTTTEAGPSVKTWCYTLPPDQQGKGGAALLLSARGGFEATCDHGCISHAWSAAELVSSDMRYEVLRFGQEYLLDRLSQGRMVYDGDRTVLAVMRLLRDAGVAEDAEPLSVFGDWSDERTFWRWLRANPTLRGANTSLVQLKTDPAVTAFVEGVWPRLRRLIVADVEADS